MTERVGAAEAAHRSWAERVRVWAAELKALPGLIAAGIDSIEHGTGLTDDLVVAVAERGIAVVPTLINIDNFPSIAAAGAEKFPV